MNEADSIRAQLAAMTARLAQLGTGPTRRQALIGGTAMVGGSSGALIPPMNAPRATQVQPAVQPGNQSPVVIAHTVIVFGPAGTPVGVFVYRPGTRPALGNPPIAWLTSGTRDPYGNPLPSTSGVAGSGTFEAGNTIIKTLGDFVYSGTPGAGNLIASITPAAGANDGFTNPFQAGINAYVSIAGTHYAMGLNQLGSGGALPGFSIQNTGSAVFSPPGIYGTANAGLGTAEIEVLSGQVNNTDIGANIAVESQVMSGVTNGSVGVGAGIFAVGSHSTFTVDDNAQTATVASGNAAASALVVSSTAVSPANLISISAPAAGNNALGILVTGDTSARLKADTNGKLMWGPGNAGQDTDLYRLAAGTLATDGVVTLTKDQLTPPLTPVTGVSLYADSAGSPAAVTQGGFAAVADLTQTSTATISSGNVTAPTVITGFYTIDNTLAIGTIYTLKTWWDGTWEGNALAFHADINGTTHQFAPTIGATAFPAGTPINGWVEMEVEIVTAAACRLSLAGAVNNNSTITPGAGHMAIGSSVITGVAIAGGNTVAIAVGFGALTAGQTITTQGSRFTRRG